MVLYRLLMNYRRCGRWACNRCIVLSFPTENLYLSYTYQNRRNLWQIRWCWLSICISGYSVATMAIPILLFKTVVSMLSSKWFYSSNLAGRSTKSIGHLTLLHTQSPRIIKYPWLKLRRRPIFQNNQFDPLQHSQHWTRFRTEEISYALVQIDRICFCRTHNHHLRTILYLDQSYGLPQVQQLCLKCRMEILALQIHRNRGFRQSRTHPSLRDIHVCTTVSTSRMRETPRYNLRKPTVQFATVFRKVPLWRYLSTSPLC